MKKVALIALVLHSALLRAADKPRPNPAEFTAKVHVVSSGIQTNCVSGLCYRYQLLEAVIGGQPVALQSTGVPGQYVGLLALDDYPARVAAEIHGPKEPNKYDVYRGYDLLMPDGTARTYLVTRLGPAISHP